MENKRDPRIGTALSAEQVRDMLRERVSTFRSQAAYARHCGVSTTVLSLVLAGKRPPTDGLLSDLHLVALMVYLPIK